MESPEHGVRELVRLGEDVEVVSLATLRTELARTLRRTLERYA